MGAVLRQRYQDFRLGAWACGLGLMVLHMDGLGAAHAVSVHSGLSPLSFALACNQIRHVLTGSLGALSLSPPPSGSQRLWQMERVPTDPVNGLPES